jgi:hypothetical protein
VEAFPWNSAPIYLVRDNDGAYGEVFLRRVRPMRIGGASSAELMALAAFARDTSLEVVGASHAEEYGIGRQAPADAVVDFQGDDP